jgi:hypothetical protein
MHFRDCQARRAAGGAPNMFAMTKLPCLASPALNVLYILYED